MLSSLLTRRNIIIAGVVAAVIIIVVIVSKSNSPIPPKPAIFKRCDGSSDPVEQITMSSCPDVHEVGYCKVFADKPSTLEVSFTPAEDYKDTHLYFNILAPRINIGEDGCEFGVRCPLRKGRTETLKFEFPKDAFSVITRSPSQVKFSIFRAHGYPENPIYCVEFPVELVGNDKSYQQD